MILIKANQTEPIASPNGNLGAALATPSTGAAQVSVIRQRQQPGGFNPPHSHPNEEVMFQLAGTVAVHAGEERLELRAGDTLIIPAGTLHRVENRGDGEAEWLIIAAAGPRFFHESGEEAHPAWAR
ncbi:MAG TPA: cupin domain-containing protein [Herpetosiphonaceae bacterium]